MLSLLLSSRPMRVAIRLDCSVLVPVLVFAAAYVHMSSCRFRRYIEKRFWLWLLLWLLALSHCRGCSSCGHCGGCAFLWCCVCGRRHHCNLCHHCCPRCLVDLVIHGVAVVVFAAHCSCNCCVCYRCGDAYSRRCCCLWLSCSWVHLVALTLLLLLLGFVAIVFDLLVAALIVDCYCGCRCCCGGFL